MRKTILALTSAAALALPLVAFAPTAGATGGTTCTKASGKAVFNPPLPKLGSSNKVTSTITVTGTESACTGGGVTAAQVSGKFKFSKPGNCQTLAQAAGGSTPGTLTLKWSATKSSTISATITQPTSSNPYLANVKGLVTAGLFKGLHFSQQVTFALSSTGGDCVHSDLKSVTYTKKTNGVIK